MFALRDQRAHPIDARPARHRAADRRHHVLHGVGRFLDRLDRLAPGGLLVEDRDRHVAEDREHEGPRDGGRRHDQEFGGAPLLGQGQALGDAEPVLLVDDDEAEVAERDAVREQRMRAHHEVDRAVREAGLRGGPVGRPVAPGQHGHAQPGGLGERRHAGAVLARQDLGRHHQGRLAAGLDHGGRGEERHHGLARADVALEQPQHPARRGHVGADLAQRPALSGGEREGQGGLDAGRDRPRRRVGDPVRHHGAVAHQRQGELARQEFVVGEALAGRRLGADVPGRLRAMQGAQGLGEARPPAQDEAVRVLPLGQVGQALQRRLDGLAEHAGEEPLGQGIDGLDQRHGGEGLAVHDPVGVHHLQAAVPELEPARHEARRAERQRLLDPGGVVAEEHQRAVAGLVLDDGPEGRLDVGRGQVLAHPALERDDLVAGGVADLGPGRAVDDGDRQVQHEVEDARGPRRRAEQAVERRRDLRADAAQLGGLDEERVEVCGTHGAGRERAEGRGRAHRVPRRASCGCGAARAGTRRPPSLYSGETFRSPRAGASHHHDDIGR